MNKIICALLIVTIMLTACDDAQLESYIPEKQIDNYYLLLDGGAIRLGAEFKDETNAFEIIEINEKKDTVRYKQELNMFDFTTTQGIITQITIPSDICLVSSKYYVGMTENQLLGSGNFLIVDSKGNTKEYFDSDCNVTIEAEYNDLTERVAVLRFNCKRLK